jgi:styrene-oxide isomerase
MHQHAILEKKMNNFQRVVAGHGVLMILCTLLFGVGFWMSVLGGFELVPGVMLEFNMPGTPEGWRKAHTGPALNGMMVLAVAVVLPMLTFEEKKSRILAWIVVADGWSNVGFYFFGNFAINRGLSFGDNKFGEADIYSTLALGPAYIFGVLAIVALFMMGKNLVSKPSQ